MNKIIAIIIVIGWLLTTSVVSVNAAPAEEVATYYWLPANPIPQPDIYVDDDASEDWYDETHVNTIQKGVNVAKCDDKIFVIKGTYEENVLISKPLTLIGQKKETTIIEGSINIYTVPYEEQTKNVNVKGFTIKIHYLYGGVSLQGVSECTISDINFVNHHNYWHQACVYLAGFPGFPFYLECNNNIIRDNNFVDLNQGDRWVYGIELNQAKSNLIFRNVIDLDQGIRILGSSKENEIIANNIIQNSIVGVIIAESYNNLFYYNNFINNGFEDPNGENAMDIGINSWYKAQGQTGIGNYWSDYEEKGGYDNNGDGIGDIPYGIQPFPNLNKDKYPLMEPVDIYSVEI